MSDERSLARSQALIASRRLEPGARVRHVFGAPRVYVVTGYTEGGKVRVELEEDRSLRGAFAPQFLERVDGP